MINRRWFFTAAGSAFLTAACAAIRPTGDVAAEPCNPNEVPADPEEQWRCLLASFFDGINRQLADFASVLPEDQLPRGRAELERRFVRPLTDIYRKRFDLRWRKKEVELPDAKYQLRLDQACVLGQLTVLAFRHEVGAVDDPSPFDPPDAAPRLGVKHLEWAREMYGFYTNPRVAKRHFITICGERAEIDEPCPFCHA